MAEQVKPMHFCLHFQTITSTLWNTLKTYFVFWNVPLISFQDPQKKLYRRNIWLNSFYKVCESISVTCPCTRLIWFVACVLISIYWLSWLMWHNEVDYRFYYNSVSLFWFLNVTIFAIITPRKRTCLSLNLNKN